MTSTSEDKVPQKPTLRMKDLMEATGLPKSTILHYLHQGLLPEPEKTSPNMAYYDPECIQRIRFIQHMQRHHRLVLSEIKKILKTREAEGDLSILVELNELIFGHTEQDIITSHEEFCRVTGLSKEQLDSLLKARLILPVQEGRVDQQDVSMGQMFVWGFARGLRIEDVLYYVELGEKIVDHEMALRSRMTHHLPPDQDAAVTMEMVKNARMSRAYILDRLFQNRVAGMADLKEGGDGS